ncbi:hypothetical protein [Methanoculleus caldifontis]|uniref:hypothetical protein n=1 Tax=Methanoculleus caldifontis TaxID=2651577 RepID=UPI0029372E8C|nr:hypothetical protein [Methanoculleus sp. Wushi-C6]
MSDDMASREEREAAKCDGPKGRSSNTAGVKGEQSELEHRQVRSAMDGTFGA